MENHGCKGCLTPSLCINYPPNLDFFKKVFFCLFLPFRICLDKIKVGGDSCLTATFRSIKSQFTVLQLLTLRLCYLVGPPRRLERCQVVSIYLALPFLFGVLSNPFVSFFLFRC